MATLPSSNYLSDAARTEAEMKTALENLRDVIAEIGSKAPTTLTIASGALAVPLSSMVLVRSEGHATGADDILNTIATSGIEQGRTIVLRNSTTASSEAASSQKVTLSHGTGANQLELADDASMILCAERMVALVYSGDHWVELWRSYGRKNAEDSTAARTDLGLGTAAVETIATSSGASANSKVLKVGASANLATDALLAIDASGNIKAGTVSGGNADTLDSLNSTDFVRSTATAAQTMAASLTNTTSGATRVNVNSTGTSTTGVGLQHSGTERGLLYLDTSDAKVYLQSKAAGGTATPQIRLNPTNDRLEFNTGTASWQSLRPGPGNGLDADTVDGNQASVLLNVLSIVANDSNGAGTGGSFRLSDGTTTLLVQWPGTWSLVGGDMTWTFPTAYSDPPIVIGSAIESFGTDSESAADRTRTISYTSTATSLFFDSRLDVGDWTYVRSVRNDVLVIGVPAS